MNKSEKQAAVSQIKELIEKSSAIYLIDYSSISVEEINEIRREFLKEGVTYKIFKNTLFKIAAEEVGGYDKFNDLLVGMTGFAFVDENIVAPAKIIKKANADFKKFDLKGCYIDSEFYSGDQLETLATMPTKDEIMASIVRGVAAPAQGIVGAVNAVMRDLASVIDQISQKDAA